MYFLGIILEENLKQGIFLPGFALCKVEHEKGSRSGWYMTNMARIGSTNRKVVVRSLIGHEDMVNFCSSIRGRSCSLKNPNYTKEEKKKYYLRGALCWCECNEYGDFTGTAIFIKRVPDLSLYCNYAFERLKKERETVVDPKDLFIREPYALVLNTRSCFLNDQPKGRRGKKDEIRLEPSVRTQYARRPSSGGKSKTAEKVDALPNPDLQEG